MPCLAAKSRARDASRDATADTTISLFSLAGVRNVVGAQREAPRMPIRTGAPPADMGAMLTVDPVARRDGAKLAAAGHRNIFERIGRPQSDARIAIRPGPGKALDITR